MKNFFCIVFFITLIAFESTASAQTTPFSASNLTAVVTNYNQENLGWFDASTDEAEFRIYRRLAYTGTWALIVTLKENINSYTDHAGPGSYEYRVNACNGYGCSNDTIVQVSITPDTIMPSTPGNFSIAKEVTATKANLSWTASSDNIAIGSYRIYRSPSTTANFSFVASVSGTQLSYSDAALAPVTQYYYYVKAADLAGNQSGQSLTADITTLSLNSSSDFIRLTYPNGGECFNINTNLPIRWTGNSVNKTAVYFGSRSKLIFIDNATSLDWYITASISYTTNASIWVVAVDGNGKEGLSDTNDAPFTISSDCSKQTVSPILAPAIPTNFKANLVNESRDIVLSWQDNSTNETEFNVYRHSLPDGKWGKLATLPQNSTSYTDVNVPQGNYAYDITACNSSGCSIYSNLFQISALPSAPNTPGKVYNLSELKDGDMISATGSTDPDVYIINSYGYKRLFLNPVIFGFYGHLGGFQNIKSTTSIARDNYGISGLFRNCEPNSTGMIDPKVYGVEVTGEDTGTLHWVNTTGEKAVTDDPNFFKKVFCINNNEFNWYKKGADYSSVNQIPSYSR